MQRQVLGKTRTVGCQCITTEAPLLLSKGCAPYLASKNMHFVFYWFYKYCLKSNCGSPWIQNSMIVVANVWQTWKVCSAVANFQHLKLKLNVKALVCPTAEACQTCSSSISGGFALSVEGLTSSLHRTTVYIRPHNTTNFGYKIKGLAFLKIIHISAFSVKVMVVLVKACKWLYALGDFVRCNRAQFNSIFVILS